MIQSKKKTEDLLLSITKNCQTFIEQTHKKAEETLEIKLIKSKQTFDSNQPVEGKDNWMIGFLRLGVYNSILLKKEENNKLELYTRYL